MSLFCPSRELLHIELYLIHLGGQVVSAPDFRLQDPGFDSRLRQKSAHYCTVLHCIEPFFITPTNQYIFWAQLFKASLV